LNTRAQKTFKYGATSTFYSSTNNQQQPTNSKTMSNLSGAKIADECIREFEEFKLRGKYGYIMYKLDMTTMNIAIDKTAAPGTSYEQFLADLPQDEARYAVKHIGYTTEDGGQRTKLVFVTWIPRDSSVKTKMLHASSLAPLKQALNGIAISLQGHTLADLQFDDLVLRCREKFR
jgi:cofilin